MKTPAGRAGRILANSLLVTASIAVALGAAELFLQIQEPYLRLTGSRAEWALGRYSAHPIWHHWLRPGRTTGTASIGPELTTEPIITPSNGLGCKDTREFDGPAPPGTHRILVLGDSFTEGYYHEQTFAAVLEDRLAEADPATRYEVINCGTSSYSPVLHYLRYTHQLSSLAPDEVIVNVDLTDVFDDNIRYRDGTVLDTDGTPVSAGPRPFSLQMIANELRFRFYLVRLIAGTPIAQVKTFTYDDIFQHHSGRLPPASDEWQRHVGYTIGMLERLLDAVSASGAHATLTMYPYREQLDSTYVDPPWHRTFEAHVAELARRKDAGFYSAFDDLAPIYFSGVPVFWSNDIHLSYIGQRAWAEAFAAHYIGARFATD